jgi:hypothetical protein
MSDYSIAFPYNFEPGSILLYLKYDFFSELFKYAAAYNLAKESSSNLVLVFNSENDYDKFVQNIILPDVQIIYMNQIDKLLSQWISRLYKPGKVSNENYQRSKNTVKMAFNITLVDEENYFEFTKQNNNGILYIIDDFKSNIFFSNFSPLFSATINQNLNEINLLRNNSVCVDFLSNPSIKKSSQYLKQEYYAHAINYINIQIINPYFYVFTDNLNLAKNIFNFENNIKFINANSSIQTLNSLNQCNSLILSDSNFGWWNIFNRKNSTSNLIIAPSPRFTEEFLTQEYYADSEVAQRKANIYNQFPYPTNLTLVDRDTKYPIVINSYRDFLDKVFEKKYMNEFSQSWLNLLQKNYQYKPNSIPNIINLIWLTKNHDPKDMGDDELEYLKNNILLLNTKDDGIWTFYLWVRDKKLTPKTINFCLKFENCKVKEITQLNDFPIINYTINSLVNNNLFSLASDVLRANILYEFGGGYIDTDYQFENSPLVLHNYFDFYAGLEKDQWQKQIGSGFIFAKPLHPIIEHFRQNIYQSYNIKRFEDIKYILGNNIGCTEAAVAIGGPYSITTAFLFKNNLNQNKDILLPKEMIHEPISGIQTLKLNNQTITLKKIGTQNYKGSWLSTCKNSFLKANDKVLFGPKNPESCIQNQVEFKINNAIEKVLKSANQGTCNINDPIEFNTHRIWLTDPDNPTLLPTEVLDLALNSIKLIDTNKNQWTHYWWMLKKEHYTLEMQTKFNSTNIIFKTVDELYPFYPGLKQAIHNAANLSYSLSVDILKWVVIHHYGGDYYDIDYQVTSSRSLNILHYCSQTHFSFFELKYILNGLVGSKKGGILAKTAIDSYIDLLSNDYNKFSHCNKQQQISLMNVYGHVKPIINLILSEQISASSMIFTPSCIMVDQSNICHKIIYGNIILSNLGFDHRFNTWTSNDNTVNTKRIEAFSKNSLNYVNTLYDICEVEPCINYINNQCFDFFPDV